MEPDTSNCKHSQEIMDTVENNKNSGTNIFYNLNLIIFDFSVDYRESICNIQNKRYSVISYFIT